MIKDINKITKEEYIEITKKYAEQNDNTIDLSETDLSNYHFNFEGATTRGLYFTNAKTDIVTFANATTGYVSFVGAETDLVNFIGAETADVNFVGSRTGDFYTNFGKCKYGGKVYNSISLDDIITVYDKPKEILGFTIYEDIRDLTYVPFAITNGIFNAHSKTIKGAIIDLRYKIETFNKNKKPIIDKIKKEGIVSKQDYRDLTGACTAGVNDFCDRHNITTDTLPLDDVLELFKDKTDYGIKEFLRYMEE